jgi:hypothetical protein
MLRISALTIALVLVAGPVALAQLPPQPPPVKGGGLSQGTDQERDACRPDVMRYCKQLVHDDGNDDVFAILGCLQSNRTKISGSCQQVLASHGQ